VARTPSFVAQLARSPFLSVPLVLDFHRMLMDGLGDEAGRFKTRRSFAIRPAGSRVEYLQPAAVPEAMRIWVERFDHERDQIQGHARLDHRAKRHRARDAGAMLLERGARGDPASRLPLT
jgi:hypothetical protein